MYSPVKKQKLDTISRSVSTDYNESKMVLTVTIQELSERPYQAIISYSYQHTDTVDALGMTSDKSDWAVSVAISNGEHESTATELTINTIQCAQLADAEFSKLISSLT